MNAQVVHAYRHLYRQGLKVIRYSTPSRHVLRSTLRNAFRSSNAQDFDPSRIANTLRFLERATEVAGLEHKIVRNLLLTRYWQLPQNSRESRVLKLLGLSNEQEKFRHITYSHHNLMLDRLNASLGTCLK